ncbi:IS3 family transposase [Kitasatospora sp. NPDC057965]|uniref:IS3 family transposase n=1 Tax=Kitasatospora sp. NPDC057965 TaxID=3346291 RepID=UPI0036D8552E
MFRGRDESVIRFRFVEDHHGAWGVKRICRVLGIGRSSFYDWRAGEQARRDRERAEDLLDAEITVIHPASRGAYGVPRVHAELRRQGRAVNRKRVERIMRERGIAGVTRRRRHGLTRQARKPVHVPDLIGRDFSAPRPGMRLVGDMTFLPTEEGWLYPATCIDLATREVVGYAMADHHRAELPVAALRMAELLHPANRRVGPT